MPTTQDILREEARDHQELAAMAYKAMIRLRTEGWIYYQAHEQLECAKLSHIARSALLELIGSDPD